MVPLSNASEPSSTEVRIERGVYVHGFACPRCIELLVLDDMHAWKVGVARTDRPAPCHFRRKIDLVADDVARKDPVTMVK